MWAPSPRPRDGLMGAGFPPDESAEKVVCYNANRVRHENGEREAPESLTEPSHAGSRLPMGKDESSGDEPLLAIC